MRSIVWPLAAAALFSLCACSRESSPSGDTRAAAASTPAPSPSSERPLASNAQASDAAAPSAHLDASLQAALAPIVAASDGRVAVTVLHLQSGARASIDGGVRLPMMSVFKLPIAVVTLAAIDEGVWSLVAKVPIAKSELRETVSPLAEAWHKGETSPTLETVLRLVLQESDNTAGDKLVTFNGGGPKLTARLVAMGMPGIDVAEQEIEIAGRLQCPSRAAPAGGWTAEAIDACPKPSKASQLAAVEREIAAAPNGATTDAMVGLLARLDRGEVLSDASRGWLRRTMVGTNTGPKRLKGLLPPGTPVAHKTGTGEEAGLTIATNDVGIVTLPNGERFAIAVFIAGSRANLATRESTIARLARASWDVFVRGAGG